MEINNNNIIHPLGSWVEQIDSFRISPLEKHAIRQSVETIGNQNFMISTLFDFVRVKNENKKEAEKKSKEAEKKSIDPKKLNSLKDTQLYDFNHVTTYVIRTLANQLLPPDAKQENLKDAVPHFDLTNRQELT